MKITAIPLEDKVEIFAEIFGKTTYDLSLTACRITFKEIKEMFKLDKLGDGLLTLTMDQAKELRDSLTEILEKQ